MGRSTVFSASLITLLAWGALAFGAEYSWAYAPLWVQCVFVAILASRIPSRDAPSAPRALLFALAGLFLVGMVSLLPAPPTLRSAVMAQAPTAGYGQLFTQVTMLPWPSWMPGAISIAPTRTVLALTFLGSLVALLAACARGFGAWGPARLVRSIMVLGFIVAFISIIQASVSTQRVYGLWRPPSDVRVIGPFINKNHLAGWLVMVLSLGTGWFIGGVATAMGHVRPRWRECVIWLASPNASEVLLTALAVATMALATIVTVSRGGLLGLATATVIAAYWLLRRQPSRVAGVIGIGFLAAMSVVAVTRGRADETLDKFKGAEIDWGGRREIWFDASRIVHDHPFTGTGLNTFGIAMLHYQTGLPGLRVVEAHNDYLQLAAEGGLMLGLPVLLTGALLVREIRRRFEDNADDIRTYWLRAGAVTGLAAIAVMEVFDFTLQMPGAAVMFVVMVAIAIHKPGYLRGRPLPPATD